MKQLSPEYWNKKYQDAETGWDLGAVSPPLKDYIDQLTDKEIKILIPGCGRAYEAIYLSRLGFKNITVADVAQEPLNALKAQKWGKSIQALQTDFFDLTGTFDLMLEQTFFCALPPEKREAYVEKSLNLLKPSGKIAGVLFDFPLTDDGPPFGGSYDEYFRLFSKGFEIKKLEKCHNSVKPRLGRELFFIFEKK